MSILLLLLLNPRVYDAKGLKTKEVNTAEPVMAMVLQRSCCAKADNGNNRRNTIPIVPLQRSYSICIQALPGTPKINSWKLSNYPLQLVGKYTCWQDWIFLSLSLTAILTPVAAIDTTEGWASVPLLLLPFGLSQCGNLINTNWNNKRLAYLNIR